MLSKNKIAEMLTACLLVSSLFMTTGCGEAEEEVPKLLEPVSVSDVTDTVTYRDIYNLTTYETEVIPELTELSFTDSGKLDSVNVTVGDNVTEGQVLASLQSSSDTYDSLCEQLENMQTDNAYYNRQLEIDIEQADLLKSYDEAESLRLKYKQQLELQAIDEDYLKSEISFEKSHLSTCKITAPCDGTIVSVKSDMLTGNYMEKGTVIFAIANEDNLYVYCDYMTEAAAAKYDRIYAEIEGCEYELAYKPYEAGAIAKLKSSDDDYYSVFSIENAGTELIGCYGRIYLVSNYVENVLSVPVNALYTSDSGYYVYVMDGDAKVMTSVEVGVKGTMYAQITDGLTEGEVVYVAD